MQSWIEDDECCDAQRPAQRASNDVPIYRKAPASERPPYGNPETLNPRKAFWAWDLGGFGDCRLGLGYVSQETVKVL